MMHDRVVDLHSAAAHAAHLECQIDILVIAEKALVKSAHGFEIVASISGGGGAGSKNREIFRDCPDVFAIASAVGDAKDGQLIAGSVKYCQRFRGVVGPDLHRSQHGHERIALGRAVQGLEPIGFCERIGVQRDDPVGSRLDRGEVVSGCET